MMENKIYFTLEAEFLCQCHLLAQVYHLERCYTSLKAQNALPQEVHP